MNTKDIASFLGCSPGSISHAVLNRLGVSVRPHGRDWSRREDDCVRKYTEQGLTAAQIANRLRRSETAVSKRRAFLNIAKFKKGFTERQIKFVKDNWSNKPAKEIALAIGKCESTVRHLAGRLKIAAPLVRTGPWNEDLDAFIRENFPTSSVEDIARQIGKNPKSVNQRMKSLKLIKRLARRPFTQEEDDAIEALYREGATPSEIARRLKRQTNGIIMRAFDLGLKPKMGWEREKRLRLRRA